MNMNADVYQLDGKVARKEELPEVFGSAFREDIVRRALLAEQSRRYQPQGHYVMAGLQTTAVYVGEYGVYRSGRHMGIAIRPRQKLAGGAQGDVRRIPSSVKGRRAHPHKIEKVLEEKINSKEYKKAIESAIGGTANAVLVKGKHSVNHSTMPIIVEDKMEAIVKTKDLIRILKILGFEADLDKSHKPKLRAGLKRYAKSRHFRKSVLIVVSDSAKVDKAGRNIAGVDVCRLKNLTVEALAPGAKPRLTIWTEGAVKGVERAIEHAKLR